LSDFAGVAPYAFAQLDSPRTVGEIGDMLATARREADQVREDARLAGHAEGYAAGMAAAREDAGSALAALAAACTEVAALHDEVAASVEHDAVALALDLAEQIVAGALAVAPERVLDVARHALRHLTDRRHVTLVVHPDDLARLSDAATDLQAELGGIEHLSVQADRRVGRGGAVARTEAGEIDAGIATQLEHAREIVAEALAS
jgi:flagellar assembly protein FliH